MTQKSRGRSALKWIGTGLAAIVGLVVLVFVVMRIWLAIDPQAFVRTVRGSNDGDALVGAPAPEFKLDVIGAHEQVALADYRGKIVVLDFWATWCAPCESTSPNIEAVRKRHEDVVVLAINVREGEHTDAADLEAHVAKYFTEAGYGFVNLQGDGELLSKYNAQTIPHIFVIDADGVLRYSGVGMHNEENVEAAIAAARS